MHLQRSARVCSIRSSLSHSAARALHCLAHPASIAAAALLVLNALWFQPAYPGWLSGKLGDAAWLVCAPLLAAATVCLLAPVGFSHRTRLAGLGVIAATGAAFALVKTSPWVNHMVAVAYAALAGRPAKLTLDPTDLLALPALLVAGRIWWRRAGSAPASAHPPDARLRPRIFSAWLRVCPALLAACALVADSPNPRGFFVECLAQDGPVLYGFSFLHPYTGGTTWTVYRSDDGGLNWRYHLAASPAGPAATPAFVYSDIAATPGITATVQAAAAAELTRTAARETDRPVVASAVRRCARRDGDWEYAPPGQNEVRYRFSKGHPIARSTDGGQTWSDEQALANEAYVVDALYHAPTGNLVLALLDANTAVMVRTPDGVWHTPQVREFD